MHCSHFRSRSENKVRLHFISLSVYAKAHNKSMKRNARARIFVQTDSPGNRFESEKIAAVSNLLHHRRGKADKIKKYCRDNPSGDFTDCGCRDVPQPMASAHPDSRGR